MTPLTESERELLHDWVANNYDMQSAVREAACAALALDDAVRAHLHAAAPTTDATPGGAEQAAWIACADRLPDMDAEVLGWYDVRGDGCWHMLVERESDGPDWRWRANGYCYCEPEEITHWQPLPSSPPPACEQDLDTERK